MNIVLDDASLLPCGAQAPAARIRRLAETLGALDRIGAPRVLRAVRDAVRRDIADGRGLAAWCFDRGTDRDAGRLIAARLNKAPYIDGPGGLFAAAEGDRVVEAEVEGRLSWGAGLVAMTDGLLVLLHGTEWAPDKPITVDLALLLEDEETEEHVKVLAVDSPSDVDGERERLQRRVDRSIGSGAALLERFVEVFPRLVLGERAKEQLAGMTGSEPFFVQVVRHLRALQRAVESWTPETSFVPEGVTFSVESQSTLSHRKYGPERDFPTPEGFSSDRWSLHTKLTGNPGARLYYKPAFVESVGPDDAIASVARVAIGYIGPHLPTVRYR